MVAGAAFADVGIGAWGRGIWAPIAGQNGDMISFEGPSWAWGDAHEGTGGYTRVGITVSGSSDNVGFNLDLNGDGGSAGVHDVAQIWVQPWSALKVSVGKTQDDTGRGNGCFGAFDWSRWYANAGVGEDLTFMRFGNGNCGQANNGAIVKITPVEALWIIAAFNVGNECDVADAYKNAQYGLGYNIDGVGHIRAQFIGRYKDADTGAINAAFDLNAVENMYLSIGAYIPLKNDLQQIKIAAYWRMSFGLPTIHVLADIGIKGPTDKADIYAGVGADFNFDNGVGVNLDVRVQKPGEDDLIVGFLVGAAKGFSNGKIGIGFEGRTGDKFNFSVPVKVEYWF